MKRDHADVIVINWNGKHHLNECLTSLVDQTHKSRDVFFVDNNSTDGSVSFIADRFPDVRTTVLEGNYGFTGANNRGIASGCGEFVALLNNDAVAHPDWLKESIACLKSDPAAGFCAAKIVNYFQRDILDTAGDIYMGGGVNAKRGSGRPIGDYDDLEYVFGACAAGAVYRREMLSEIGLFDEDFFIMCEDVDLSFRAQLAGYKCIYNPRAIVYHKVHGTIKDIDSVFGYYGQRNVEYVYFKNMPGPLLLRFLPMHIVYNLSMFCVSIIEGRLLSFIASKISFLFHLPRTTGKRRAIQKNKKVTNKYVRSLISKNWLLDKIRQRWP